MLHQRITPASNLEKNLTSVNLPKSSNTSKNPLTLLLIHTLENHSEHACSPSLGQVIN